MLTEPGASEVGKKEKEGGRGKREEEVREVERQTGLIAFP
jgi:hypothetical protein